MEKNVLLKDLVLSEIDLIIVVIYRVTYNHFHNTLGIFYLFPNFRFTASEMKCD